MSSAIDDSTLVFQAFADATRVRLLNLLMERELCVCDLCSLLAEEQPKISRHLAYLRNAQLVEVRQDGKWKHYRIARSMDPLRRSLIRCIKSCLREIAVLQEDVERLCLHGSGKCG